MTTVPAAVECAMEQHARWHNDWHPYWGDYTWQRLGAGHRAAGDCRTVIERLREMAAGADPTTDPSAGHTTRADNVHPIE